MPPWPVSRILTSMISEAVADDAHVLAEHISSPSFAMWQAKVNPAEWRLDETDFLGPRDRPENFL